MLMILTILTVLACSTVIVGIVVRNRDTGNTLGIGLIALLVIGMIGWGMVGNCATVQTKCVKVIPAFTADRAFFVCEHQTLATEKISQYNRLKQDSTIECGFNMYGNLVDCR